MLFYLALINFGLAVFDAWLTRRRILRYGVQVEGTSYIKPLVTDLGVETGVGLGILLPAFLTTLIFVALDWPIALALLVGYRTRYFIIQIQSMLFEREARKLQKEINLRGNGGLPPPPQA